jgi:predicted dehydrogenase
MHKVRLGLIGYGNMGAGHAAQILGGKIPRLVLTAVTQHSSARRPSLPGVKVFADPVALLRSGLVDAVLIATPHPTHAPLALAALKAGFHVLLEKPFAVHKAEALQVAAAAKRRPRQIFGLVFNQRTDPYFRKIRELIRGGTFGPVRRIHWTITNWFRPEAYYQSSSWRATWAGEGGGVLLNQCPHNLDLLQWMTGMPVCVRAHCHFGRYHDIEVEDDVSAYLEYADGAHATFIASTGEAPGTNRLEIALDGGRIVYEHDVLQLTRNTTPASTFSRTSRELFLAPGQRRRAGVVARGAKLYVNALWMVVAALCVFAISYRFHSAWLMAKVLTLDDLRATPAKVHGDGRDFVKTNKWVVFGHHFAAIAGTGPLVGPVLAAQFGYLPGLLWMLVGATLGGAVHDSVVLFCSTRRRGKSLGQMVRDEVGPFAGHVALVSIIAIMVILLAVLALVVVKALAESPWGLFTIAMTMPIAIVMGVAMRHRPQRQGPRVDQRASAWWRCSGGLGRAVPARHALEQTLTLKGTTLAWWIMGYGFLASVLPVWLLLAPRDYLSTFMKIGTVIGARRRGDRARADLKMPAITKFIDGTGPVFAGPVFPFCLHHHRLRGDLGLPLAHLLGHDAQAAGARVAHPHRRLRRDGHRDVRRHHGADRGLRDGARASISRST